MPVYDFSSGFSGLNQGISALGRGMKNAHDWEEGERLASMLFGGNATPGAPAMASPGAPIASPGSISALGQPGGPRPVQVAETEEDVRRLEAGMMPGAPAAPAFNPQGKLPIFAAKEAEYGLPQGYLSRTAQVESGGNPNARNPNSSAGGLFQFIDGTAKQYGLTNKFDPDQSTDAAARLAADNKRALASTLGREPTAGELYLAHQQGGGGAAKLLANPDARAIDVVGPKAVQLNGGDPNMTAREFASKWVSKIDGGGAADAPAPGAQEARGFVVPGGGGGGGGISPQQKLIIAQMVRNPETRAAGLALWQQSMKAPEVKTVDLGQSIGVMDSQGNILREIPKRAAPKEPEAFTLSEGQQRFDAQGNRIAGGAPEPARPMTEEEKAAFGIPPGTGAYMQNGKPVTLRGTASTNVNVNGENAPLRKKLSEKEAEIWSGHQKTGTISGSLGQDFEVLDALMKVAPQGPITGRLAEAFPGFSKAGDAFQSIVKRVAPSLRTEGSGSTSDIEYEGMLQSLPRLSNNPGANLMIAETMKAKAALNVQRGQIVSAFQNGDLDERAARQQLQALDKVSIMSPGLKQMIGAGAAPKAPPQVGTVKDGYRYNGGNPADPSSWGKVQ